MPKLLPNMNQEYVCLAEKEKISPQAISRIAKRFWKLIEINCTGKQVLQPKIPQG